MLIRLHPVAIRRRSADVHRQSSCCTLSLLCAEQHNNERNLDPSDRVIDRRVAPYRIKYEMREMIGTFRVTRTFHLMIFHDPRTSVDEEAYCNAGNTIFPQENDACMVLAIPRLREPIATSSPRLVLSLSYRAKMDGCF